MKHFRLTVTVLFLLSGMFAISCNNSGKNAQKGAADSSSMAISFNNQVKDFDSSWNERMTLLDKRIDQWDSSAQTYKGMLHERMQKQVNQLKVHRDSLKAKLQKSGDQAEETWIDFRNSVNAQYDSIITIMRNLGTANQ